MFIKWIIIWLYRIVSRHFLNNKNSFFILKWINKILKLLVHNKDHYQQFIIMLRINKQIIVYSIAILLQIQMLLHLINKMLFNQILIKLKEKTKTLTRSILNHKEFLIIKNLLLRLTIINNIIKKIINLQVYFKTFRWLLIHK
jgi:hypothetical protein